MSEVDTAIEGTQDASQVVGDIVENQWSLSEGVAGQGDRPEWFKADKYKTVADQAQAYTSLESKFGSFTGAPDEFTVNLSDEIKEKGIELTGEDPMMEEAMKFAKESNMSQEGFDNMVNLYAMSKLAEGGAIEEHKAEQMKALGENAQGRIDNLNAWADKNLSPEMVEGFQGMATSAAAIETIEHLVSLSRSGALNPVDHNPAQPTSSEEVRKMQFEKDEHGNRRIQTDPEFKARYEKMRDQVWGSEPNRIVVGR